MGCLTRQKPCSQTRRYRFGFLRCRLISRAVPAPALPFDHIRIIFEYLTIPRTPASKRNIDGQEKPPSANCPHIKNSCTRTRMQPSEEKGKLASRPRQKIPVPANFSARSGTPGCPERGAPPTKRRLTARCGALFTHHRVFPVPEIAPKEAPRTRKPRHAQVPEIALKEERRVLKVRKRRLKGKVGCLSAPEPAIRCRRR